MILGKIFDWSNLSFKGVMGDFGYFCSKTGQIGQLRLVNGCFMLQYVAKNLVVETRYENCLITLKKKMEEKFRINFFD